MNNRYARTSNEKVPIRNYEIAKWKPKSQFNFKFEHNIYLFPLLHSDALNVLIYIGGAYGVIKLVFPFRSNLLVGNKK